MMLLQEFDLQGIPFLLGLYDAIHLQLRKQLVADRPEIIAPKVIEVGIRDGRRVIGQLVERSIERDGAPGEFAEIAMCGILVVFIFWGGLYPNTFLKPMESAIGATRMMAINPVGQRPSWSDETHQIDENLNLVAGGKIIAPANLHFPLNKDGTPKKPVEEPEVVASQ